MKMNSAALLFGMGEAVKPVIRKPLARFIEEDYRLDTAHNASPQMTLFGYQRALCEILDDPATRRFTARKSTRTGFTAIVTAFLVRELDQNPGPLGVYMPTDAMADELAERDLTPALQVNASVAAKLKHKPGSARDKASFREVPGGSLRLLSAATAKSFRGHTFRVVAVDEFDAVGDGATAIFKEGSPIKLIERRLHTFDNSLLIAGGSPVNADGLTETEFLKGTQSHWAVQCLDCDSEFVYLFANDMPDNPPVPCVPLLWDDDEDDKALPDTAHVICPECGGVHHADQQDALNERGRFVPFNPDPEPGHISVYFWAGLAGFEKSRWPNLVREFLDARDKPQELQTWLNTLIGLPWQKSSRGISLKELEANASDGWSGEVAPAQVEIVTAGVDVQGDRIEVLRTGWDALERSYLLEHKVIMGDTASPKGTAWQELYEYLKTPSPHELVGQMKVLATCIDHGHSAIAVEAFTSTREARDRQWWAVKGASVATAPAWPVKASRSKRGKSLFVIGQQAIAKTIYAYMQISDPSQTGFVNYPDAEWFDDAFKRQLASEGPVEVKTARGTEERIQVREGYKRNEAIDILRYSYAALLGLKKERRYSLASATADNRKLAERRVREGQAEVGLLEAKDATAEKAKDFGQKRRKRKKPGRRITPPRR